MNRFADDANRGKLRYRLGFGSRNGGGGPAGDGRRGGGGDRARCPRARLLVVQVGTAPNRASSRSRRLRPNYTRRRPTRRDEWRGRVVRRATPAHTPTHTTHTARADDRATRLYSTFTDDDDVRHWGGRRGGACSRRARSFFIRGAAGACQHPISAARGRAAERAGEASERWIFRGETARQRLFAERRGDNSRTDATRRRRSGASPASATSAVQSRDNHTTTL